MTTDNKQQETKPAAENRHACGACGDNRTMLTEDRHALPRCAGCGALKQDTK